MLRRREFLTLPLAPALAAAPSGEWRNRQPGMAYRRHGRTGFMISEVVMGGNRISPDNWEHILRALDMGLNYLDTAPNYGRGASEQGYAKVLKSRPRDQFFLNTKVSLWDNNRNKLFKDIFDSLPASDQARIRKTAREEVERRQADAPDYFVHYFNGQQTELEWTTISNAMEKEYGRRIDREKNYKKLILDSVEESLGRLGTDHLDLMTCPHGATTAYELFNFPEIFEAFEILKQAGKVRHLSVSAHNDPAGVLRAAVQTGKYSAAMVAYNIVNHRYVDAAIEQAKQKDLGVIAMKVARAVHGGRDGRPDTPERVKLIEDAVRGSWSAPQKAYLWGLGNPNLSAVVADMTSREMVEDDVPLAGKRA